MMTSLTAGASSSNAFAQSKSLSQLPEELFASTTRYLAFKDVKQLSLVSKKLRKLCSARLFSKVTVSLPARVERGLSLQQRIRTRYQTFRYIRELELHIGCQKAKIFEKQDLEAELHDFATFFAMVQASITDIHYNFYVRPAGSDGKPEKLFIEEVMRMLLSHSRISSIRGHIYASNRYRSGPYYNNDVVFGCTTALPLFNSKTHLHGLFIDRLSLQHEEALALLSLLPTTCQISHCAIQIDAVPEAITQLPSSLQSLTIRIFGQETFHSGTWCMVFSSLQTACPKLVHLVIIVNDVHSCQEASLPDFMSAEAIRFPQLRNLELSCYLISPKVLQSFHAVLALLHTPSLRSLTMKGDRAWYCLSLSDARNFIKRNPVKTITLGENFGYHSMRGSDLPWHGAESVAAISQPLFNNMLEGLKDVGVKVNVCGEVEGEDGYTLRPDEPQYQHSLATFQDHITSLQVSLEVLPDTDLPPPPRFDRVYRLPLLRSLRVYCNTPYALPFVARALDLPLLERLDIIVDTLSDHQAMIPDFVVKAAGQAAMIVGEMTEIIREGRFGQLRSITGEIAKLRAEENGDSLIKWFKKAFLEVCMEKGIDTRELAWK